MADVVKWTIQGLKGSTVGPKQEFDTKGQANRAMQSQREPKTPIIRSGRDYTFTLAGK